MRKTRSWLLLACTITTLWLAGCAATPGDQFLVPRIDGPAWKIAGDPDLGEFTDPKQQPVDFGIWQADDGTWQLWSCIRSTRCGGKTRLFHRWEGGQLTDHDWKPMGIAMQADANYGETPGGLQAPYVCKPPSFAGADYIMFYGDWVNICLARSEDGKKFTRWTLKEPHRPALFSEGPHANTRDPMAIRIGEIWYCYYTAHPNQQGAVYCRSSPDLVRWSAPKIVSRGGRGGGGFNSAECPFVVQRGGYFYLFRTQHYGQNATTHVYRSKDPLNFGIDDESKYVTSLPAAAPEIVSHDGQDYIAFLLPTLKGIQIARLAWDTAATAAAAQ
jgi:hypothetical protein